MIIEIDDKEIEVDEEDLNSLLHMLNKQSGKTKKPEIAGRVEQLYSLLAMLNGEEKKSDPTPIMIAHFETALKKLTKTMTDTIKAIPPPPPPPKDVQVKFGDDTLPNILSSVEMMINRMSREMVSAVNSIPVPVIPPQNNAPVVIPKTDPVKRIVVGDIERGQSGLIKSCVLEVER
jgi:hypothetical protein